MGKDDDEIEPQQELWDKGIIVLAALLTLAALGAVYFLSVVPPGKTPPPAQLSAPSNEVTVGILPSKPAGKP
jgi:hypothetical protein